MKQITGLNEEELMLMEAFVRGPGYPALRKAIEIERERVIGMLTTAGKADELFQHQGRILGLNFIDAIPAILAQTAEVLKKKREALEKKSA